jgi:glycosyltransferase involved in cell wall biosynthesis
MLTLHRWIRTWQTKVDVFLCSTFFYRDLFLQAGLPPEKLVVMPHFVPERPKPESKQTPGDYALFVGRLDPEKGVKTLLEAWRALDIPLRIRGNGQLEDMARNFVRQHGMNVVEFIGRLDENDLSDLIRKARFLVLPSEGFYETFGMVIIEAYSRGVPVLAARIGVATELVLDNTTGVFFAPGDAGDMADKATWLWEHPEQAHGMGINALNIYRERYTQQHCYKTLIEVYERLIDSK